jgi:hypothetical protein
MIENVPLVNRKRYIIGMISFVILFVYYLVKPVHSQLLNQYTLIISFALSIILLRLFLYIAVDMAFFRLFVTLYAKSTDKMPRQHTSNPKIPKVSKAIASPFY